MTWRYNSFVLLHRQRDGECRVDVEHRRSGACLRNATLATAVGWIGTQRGNRDDQGATTGIGRLVVGDEAEPSKERPGSG